MKVSTANLWLTTASVLFLMASPLPVSAAVADAPAHAKAPANIAAIDALMADAIAKQKLAGAAIGVMRDGKIVFLKGYGMADLEDGQPVRPDTIFRMASITKQFTAAMVLKLVDQGKLSLSDPISKYFPDFPKAEGITVRHLLDHTSGIRSYTDQAFMDTRAWRDHDSKELVSLIAGQDNLRDFPVGTDYLYNNSAYVLAGVVIEKVTGKSYGAAFDELIAKPLGLTDTAYDDERAIVPRRSKGYGVRDGKIVFALPLAVSVSGGAGSLRSTATDMLRWHQALLGGKLLKPESLALMLQPGRLSDGRLSTVNLKPDAQGRPPMNYGFGIQIGERDGRRAIGHGGTINGFTSRLYTYPDDRTTIVLLANTDDAAHELYNDVAAYWFGAAKLSAK